MRRTILVAASLAALVAGVVFVGFPRADILISGLFHPTGYFLFSEKGFAEAVRILLDLMFWTVCAAALAGLLRAVIVGKPLFGRGMSTWLFLTVLLVTGPGLVANSLFKENWGRARPDEIVAFGGHKAFSPAMIPSDQCTRNCSFVGGEVSSIFAAALGLAMLAERRRRIMFGAALALGGLASLIRVGQGAHFLSDAVFAMIFMAFVAVSAHWFVFGRAPLRLRARLRRGDPVPEVGAQ